MKTFDRQKYYWDNENKILRYHKKYAKTNNGKLASIRADEKYSKRNQNKIKAQNKLKYIFKFGNISNAELICAICGKQPIDKHHENYNLWYVFIPLCRQCHVNIRR